MSGVFQNMNPTPPSPPSVYPRLWFGGRTHSLGGEGGDGVNLLEDARHSSVLYICKYFVFVGMKNKYLVRIKRF
jgi:hypothetical protein